MHTTFPSFLLWGSRGNAVPAQASCWPYFYFYSWLGSKCRFCENIEVFIGFTFNARLGATQRSIKIKEVFQRAKPRRLCFLDRKRLEKVKNNNPVCQSSVTVLAR